MEFVSVNPATGEKIKEYPEASENKIKRAIDEAQQVGRAWRQLSFESRGEKLKRAAQILRSGIKEYALLMAREMGKPLKQGEAEIGKCAWGLEYYAQEAGQFLRDEIVQTDAAKSYVHFEPLGVILSIMPWNFPFWQVFRGGAPGLMAGNAVLLKHAPNVTGCALAIQGVMEKAGFPPGLFRAVLIPLKKIPAVIADPGIAAVTLTGSPRAGKAVALEAARVLKKTVLELGGSDPYVVLEDADLEKTVQTCVASRLINGGQTCISAKRFIVVRSIRKKFEERMVDLMGRQKMGDPTEEGTTLGPMARMDLRNSLHDQVVASVRKGAQCLLGGEKPSREGSFYPPTVLSGVKRGMAAFDDETFGPVAAIVEAPGEREAVLMANDTPYGLGAAIFTSDREKGERIASRELEAGSCFVNSYVKSDPRLPFGGIKGSGYGRELGIYGIKEFTNIKTVSIA